MEENNLAGSHKETSLDSKTVRTNTELPTEEETKVATDDATPTNKEEATVLPVASNSHQAKSSSKITEEARHHTSEEADSSEKTTEEASVEKARIDYSLYDKLQLIQALVDLSNSDEGYKNGKAISAIKKCYQIIFKKEKEECLEKFIEDGGDKNDFQFKLDKQSIKFETYATILREKKSKNAKKIERQKEKNLTLKNELLERLRVFIDDDENTASIDKLKKMQEEWRNIGQVHHQHNNTLWFNYHALIDRYYDHRSIYFELKELDRKKNLVHKIEICEQAEALHKLENLYEAIKRLNKLHEEYKHIGPIPKEVQEETWQRFKAASDAIYTKRKGYVTHLKEKFSHNYDKKVIIADKVSEFVTFEAEKISDWNEATKTLQAYQKEWEQIGAMPKEYAKAINKKFWNNLKIFFHNKSLYFKTLDAARDANLKLQQTLVDKAVAQQQDTEDWDKTAIIYKNLQKEWKEIGAVPGKEREKIYKKFKIACDTFFNKKRNHNKGQQIAFEENLTQKKIICAKLEALTKRDNLNPEQVYELQDAFNSIDFVPKKAIKSIQNRYDHALHAIIKNAKKFKFDKEGLEELKTLVKINKIKSGSHGEQKLHRKEYALRKKIQTLEKDIAIWQNNLSFFGNSKSASGIRKEFQDKIEKARADLVKFKQDLEYITYTEL